MSSDMHKEPEQLEREVQAAREQLSHTVDEISSRLSPGELLDQALNVTKGYGGDFARNLGQQAKDNPLALMVTGVGMAWMMLGDQQKSNDHTQGHQSYPSGAQARSQTAFNTGDTHYSDPNDTAESFSLGQSDSDTNGEQIKDYAKSAQTQLQRTLEEQPLMAGALGVALGAALGALIPPSEAEDHLMGETSDNVTDKATQVAAEKYEETKETLKQKVSAATDQETDNVQAVSDLNNP